MKVHLRCTGLGLYCAHSQRTHLLRQPSVIIVADPSKSTKKGKRGAEIPVFIVTAINHDHHRRHNADTLRGVERVSKSN